MSVTNDPTENDKNYLLTLDYVKQQKDLVGISKFDDVLTSMVITTNQAMMQYLVGVVDIFDLSGTSFFDQARNHAYDYFEGIYMRRQNKKYADSIEMLKQVDLEILKFVESLKAQPAFTDRSRAVSVSASYETALIENIPNMTDESGTLRPDRL